MFASGSIKSSKWGWDSKQYPARYSSSYESTSTVGTWSPLTLAPNGFYYGLPRVFFKNAANTIPAQDVLCFQPGKSNNKTNKWQTATVNLIPAVDGVGSKQPLLPPFTPPSPAPVASAQHRFPSKGVLSHAVGTNIEGFIYYFGWSEKYYVRVQPQPSTNINPPTSATQWEVIPYSSTSPAVMDPGTSGNASNYSGGVLGRDGYIYLIPCPGNSSTSIVKQRTIRIKPRNTSINSSPSDIVETGYHDASTPAKYFNRPNGPYSPGVDINGTLLTVPSNVSSWQPTTTAGASLSNGISHPNGKIYLFGGVSPRIYILDPSKWGTPSEIYTSNTLYFPNITSVNPPYGWLGQNYSATLEKLRPGQDPSTLKIIFGWGGAYLVNTNSSPKKYTATIVFDPVTETFTSNLYDQTTNEGLVMLPNNTNSAMQTTSLINLPNGHIFQSTVNNAGSPDGSKNLFGKLIYFNNDVIKYMGPQKRNILSQGENTPIFNLYTGLTGQGGWAASTPGIKSSFGKTVYSSVNGGCEITSVKGFYPRIKHFSYRDDNSIDFNSKLKTHIGVTVVNSNQVKLLGVDLVSSLPVASKFILSNTLDDNDGVYNITARSLSGSDTLITVSQTTLNASVDSTAVFTYGQLVEFPNNETLRIWGVDLTNSMYGVLFVNIQGSSMPGNNGTKQIYTNSDPFYENGYTELYFMPGTLTPVGPEVGVTMSYQYTLNDTDVYDIPSDLSTLPTSLWNSYFNIPR